MKESLRYDPLAVDDSYHPPIRNGEHGFKKSSATVVNRVFYIDVSNVPPHSIPEYMARVKDVLSEPNKDKGTFVENAKAVGLWEDFFIPVKGVIPGQPSLWQRIKEFFLGRPERHISATRIELHQVEVQL